MDDRLLATRIAAGDEAAFDEFFDACFPPAYRFALRRLGGDEDAAEEVVQAAMSKAVEKMSGFRGEATLLTWLFAICRHEIAAWLRKTKREPAHLAEEIEEIAAAAESVEGDPESITARRETARLVQAALDHLPRHYGDALEWKYIQALSVAEIAERLGVSVKAAESLLTRARDAFREVFSSLASPMEGEVR